MSFFSILFTIILINQVIILYLFITFKLKKMSLDLTALEAEAARTATLEGQANTELTGATTQAQIDTITATLKTANDALAATINPAPAPAA